MGKLNVVIPATNVIVEGVEYRKVEREAAVGDIVRITDEDALDSSYVTHNGFYRVNRLDFADDPQIKDNDDDEFDLCGWTYEVYEKVTEETQTAEDDSVVTYEGKQYRKVNRNANTGDTVIVTAWESHRHLSFNPTRVGDVFTSVEVDRDFDAHVGDYYVIYRSEYNVLEPVEAKAERFSVGDYVKVVDNLSSSGIPRGCTYVGEIRKIVEIDGSHVPYRAEKLDGSDYDWFREGKLVRATDEEVAAAKAKLDLTKRQGGFKPGDTAKITSTDAALCGFCVNDKVTVAEYDPTECIYSLKVTKGSSFGFCDAEHLAKVTAEELAQEALTAKWAAIGRKVNEYKAGDIVEVIKIDGGITNGHPVGTIGIVDFDTIVQGAQQGNPKITLNGKGLRCNVKLVTPVEQRFDRVG
jgi:ribosomal protein L21E